MTTLQGKESGRQIVYLYANFWKIWSYLVTVWVKIEENNR